MPTTGLASNDYATQVPFTDNSDKGDLRLDWQINPKNSTFLRISDRKETGVNYPAIPIPLDGQTNGTIRILDQQIALGYTYVISSNKVLDVRLGLDRTKAGKFNLSIGNTAFSTPGQPGFIPGLPSNPVSPAVSPPSASPASPASAVRAPTPSGRIPPCSIPRSTSTGSRATTP